MKSAALRLCLAIVLLISALIFQSKPASAHCHQLVDKTGDSGSSFSFTDIVSTELSNSGDSIGVRITTAGNIPNSFGTTGQMIFGVIFPTSLLSQNQNETGINFITVHTKEDGTGWEGSQFIYSGDDIKSIPWNASISIDGKTATFSIPKTLIGKGDLAYLVSIGLISEDTNSNDYAPDNSFSDCYITPVSSPLTQTGGSSETNSPTSTPQTVTEAPKKEGNKFVERPGVNRINQKDVAQSLVLPEKTTVRPQVVASSSPQPAVETVEAAKPPTILVGLVIIALLGALTIGGANLILKDEGAKTINDCELLRIRLKNRKERLELVKNRLKARKEQLKKLKEKSQKEKGSVKDWEISDLENIIKVEEAEIAALEKEINEIEAHLAECDKKRKEQEASATAASAGAGAIPKDKVEPEQGCKQGDVRIVSSTQKTYRFLDTSRDIYFETDYKLPSSGDDGKALQKILKGLKLAAKGAAMAGNGHPASIPAAAIAAILGMASDVAGTLPKIKGKFKVLYLEIPVLYQTFVCERQEICAGGKWYPRTMVDELPAVEDVYKMDFPPIMVEDIPSFIKKMKNEGQLNDSSQVDPCAEKKE